jgi:hypothetical protein
MGSRIINVKSLTMCPACSGKSGVCYQVRARAKYRILWGIKARKKGQFVECIQANEKKEPQSVVCIDCGVRMKLG